MAAAAALTLSFCSLFLLKGSIGAPLGAHGIPLQEGEEPFPWEWGGERSPLCEACQAIAELLCNAKNPTRGSTNTLLHLYSSNSNNPALFSLEKEPGEGKEAWLRRRQQIICDGGLMKFYAGRCLFNDLLSFFLRA